MKALSLRPEDRYQSVTDIQREIEAYQGGFATAAEKAGALKQAASVVDAEYRCEFAYHAQMEPLNSVAAVSAAGDAVEIWCGTQSQTMAVAAVAKALGIAPERVTFHGTLLGGGFASRLMDAIRVQRGLSYGVRSRFLTSGSGGLFAITTFTKLETTAEIVKVALDETARFADGGPTEEELERTRAYLCGLFPLSLETHDQLAEKLADLALYGLSDEEVSAFRERVRAVTPEAAREVGRRYFPLADRLVVAVGPAKAVARALERYGPVSVVPAVRRRLVAEHLPESAADRHQRADLSSGAWGNTVIPNSDLEVDE